MNAFYLIFRATCQQSNKIVDILHTYGEASGQQVNFSKSEMTFSKNVRGATRYLLKGILGVKEVDKHERYLGLLTMIDRSKKVIFQIGYGRS